MQAGCPEFASDAKADNEISIEAHEALGTAERAEERADVAGPVNHQGPTQPLEGNLEAARVATEAHRFTQGLHLRNARQGAPIPVLNHQAGSDSSMQMM